MSSGTAATAMAAWDPTAVVAKAKELIHASNYEKVNEARKAVDDTIANWVHTVQQLPLTDGPLRTRGAALIAAAWREYAALEIALRQFKQATKVFERAVSCPVASPNVALWLQYATFCVDRRKFSNARKVFLRALAAVESTDDRQAIWPPFHAFVVAHVEPTMSLATLQAQVPLPVKPATTTVDTAPTAAPTAAPLVNTLAAPTAAKPAAGASAPTGTASPKSVAATLPNAVVPVAATPMPLLAAAPVTLNPAVPAVPTSTPVVVQAAAAPVPAHAPAAKPLPAPTPVLDLDPSLAFVDRTGSATPDSRKRNVIGTNDSDPNADASKRAKTLATAMTAVQEPVTRLLTLPPLALGDDLQHFYSIPTTLPVIPTCRHLLFDALAPGERLVDPTAAVCDALPDVLRSGKVFTAVNDLAIQQRARDRATLYRWQDLVSMQMKEGSELFARHVNGAHPQHPSATVAAILAQQQQQQQLMQRREFIARCQMSQQQFIEITGMDRANALTTQQQALAALNVPEMHVTTDAAAVAMQRAILALILEAEKLWREETSKQAAAAAPKPTPASKPAPTPKRAVANDPRASGFAKQQQQQQQSHGHANRNSSSGSFRGGRSGGGSSGGGGGYGGRGGGGGSGAISAEHRYSNPRSSAGGAAPHSARSGSYRRDHDAYASGTAAGGYDRPAAASRQQQQPLHVRSASNYQAAPYQQQPMAQQPRRGASGYSDRSAAAYARDYSPDFGPQDGGRSSRFDGDATGAWQQQPPARHARSDFGPSSSSRYRSASSDSGQLLPHPAAAGSYANGRGRAYGGANSMGLPPQYDGYGAYADAGPAPMQQQQRVYQQQPAPQDYDYDDDSSDYGAPPPYAAPRAYQQQAAPFQPRSGRGGRGGRGGSSYSSYPQQQQQPMHMSAPPPQAQSYGRGGSAYRRGGGGGRFGRR